MERSWKCPSEKIKLIYHGTKLVDIPPKIESRKKLKIPLDTKVVLSWGFIWESKGINELIEILAEFKKSFSNKIMFIHAGGLHPIFLKDDYLKNLFKKAQRLGLTPNDLVVTGFIKEDEIPIYFSAADVIVSNYMRGSASASGAAHRALASSRPIVKTDDLCLEEIPGYTVPRFDKNSLYQGILKVLNSPDLQNELVTLSLKEATETSWDITATKHF
jgi:glycosyltransferase involved in cell wall biosynthesis